MNCLLTKGPIKCNFWTPLFHLFSLYLQSGMPHCHLFFLFSLCHCDLGIGPWSSSFKARASHKSQETETVFVGPFCKVFVCLGVCPRVLDLYRTFIPPFKTMSPATCYIPFFLPFPMLLLWKWEILIKHSQRLNTAIRLFCRLVNMNAIPHGFERSMRPILFNYRIAVRKKIKSFIYPLQRIIDSNKSNTLAADFMLECHLAPPHSIICVWQSNENYYRTQIWLFKSYFDKI